MQFHFSLLQHTSLLSSITFTSFSMKFFHIVLHASLHSPSRAPSHFTKHLNLPALGKQLLLHDIPFSQKLLHPFPEKILPTEPCTSWPFPKHRRQPKCWRGHAYFLLPRFWFLQRLLQKSRSALNKNMNADKSWNKVVHKLQWKTRVLTIYSLTTSLTLQIAVSQQSHFC